MMIQWPALDLTFNKDICLKYADLSKCSKTYKNKSLWVGPAEVDPMAQHDPFAPPALDSVYKVPTPLISTPLSPEL